MLQYGHVLSICIYVCRHYGKQKKGKFSSALTLPNQAALQQGIWPYMATLHWEPGCLLLSVSLTVKYMYL